MTRLRNSVLYHFVGWGSPLDDETNFSILCKVLASGQVGRIDAPINQIIIDPTREIQKGELIQQSVTCYCDISFDDLDLHVAKYGKFGVGIDREALCDWGARPVAYIPVPGHNRGSSGLMALDDAKALLKGVCEHLRSESGERKTTRIVGEELKNREMVIARLSSTFTREYLAYTKFYNSSLPVEHPEHYYAEREWRKFGPMPLRMGLREIVVPANFVDRLIALYPDYRQQIRVFESGH